MKLIEDGWHELNEYIDYYVEDGVIKRGTSYYGEFDYKPAYPYKPSRDGNGFDRWYDPKATKANLNKIYWY